MIINTKIDFQHLITEKQVCIREHYLKKRRQPNKLCKGHGLAEKWPLHIHNVLNHHKSNMTTSLNRTNIPVGTWLSFKKPEPTH